MIKLDSRDHCPNNDSKGIKEMQKLSTLNYGRLGSLVYIHIWYIHIYDICVCVCVKNDVTVSTALHMVFLTFHAYR